MNEQVDIIRQYSDRPITTNLLDAGINSGTGIDYFKLSKTLDFVSWDNYINFQWGIAEDACVSRDQALLRSYKHAPYWVMEQQAGAIGWTQLGSVPEPGQLRLWTYSSVANGADTVVFFRWRSCLFGTEEYWNDSSSAEDCMSVDRSGLHIARIPVSEGGRYPCGTYIIRSSVTNPYNHAVRHAYYTFDLILDINIIPNVVMDLTRDFTERVGYYDYRHKVESYRLGLTYHCPMAYKGSTIVERVFPQVRAKFYYDDPNENGARIIESYTSTSEDDYNGPRTAAVDIAGIKSVYLTGTTADTVGDYWTSIGYSNSDMYENVLEVPHTYMGSLFFMWYFNAKGDSTQYLDFLPADKGWKDTQDGGFYHIGKRTDTCIENTYDDGWLHY